MKYYANFKLNKTSKEVVDYFEKFNQYNINQQVCFFVSPALIDGAVKSTEHPIGTQNIASQKWGAFTGETSIEQAIDLGCKSMLIGHSERRRIFNESDALIAEKVKLAKEYNVEIVLCVGETLLEREQKFDVIKRQLTSALDNLSNYSNIIIAYEPVWAIGTGVVAQNADIDEMANYINSVLKQNYNTTLPILYGGSVKTTNVKELKTINSISGFLVGGASLEPDEFYQLIIS